MLQIRTIKKTASAPDVPPTPPENQAEPKTAQQPPTSPAAPVQRQGLTPPKADKPLQLVKRVPKAPPPTQQKQEAQQQKQEKQAKPPQQEAKAKKEKPPKEKKEKKEKKPKQKREKLPKAPKEPKVPPPLWTCHGYLESKAVEKEMVEDKPRYFCRFSETCRLPLVIKASLGDKLLSGEIPGLMVYPTFNQVGKLTVLQCARTLKTVPQDHGFFWIRGTLLAGKILRLCVYRNTLETALPNLVFTLKRHFNVVGIHWDNPSVEPRAYNANPYCVYVKGQLNPETRLINIVEELEPPTLSLPFRAGFDDKAPPPEQPPQSLSEEHPSIEPSPSPDQNPTEQPSLDKLSTEQSPEEQSPEEQSPENQLPQEECPEDQNPTEQGPQSQSHKSRFRRAKFRRGRFRKGKFRLLKRKTFKKKPWPNITVGGIIPDPWKLKPKRRPPLPKSPKPSRRQLTKILLRVFKFHPKQLFLAPAPGTVPAEIGLALPESPPAKPDKPTRTKATKTTRKAPARTTKAKTSKAGPEVVADSEAIGSTETPTQAKATQTTRKTSTRTSKTKTAQTGPEQLVIPLDELAPKDIPHQEIEGNANAIAQ